MQRCLPVRPDLDRLRSRAEALARGLRAGDADAIARCRAHHPRVREDEMSVSDAQLVIAREYGFASWLKLEEFVTRLEAVERRVAELRQAFAAGDPDTRRRLLARAHAPERLENPDQEAASLSEADARLLLANQEGYASWHKYDSYLHLDPAVQAVIDAVRVGDANAVKDILRDAPWASGPRWVAGFPVPQPIPNDSIPLFCVAEGSCRRTNTRGNEYELVRDLVDGGAEVDIQKGLPLVGAISFNVITAVEALLDCGAAVDGVDQDGAPLAQALHFGYGEIAELLSRRGARLDLRFAAGLGRLDAVKQWFDADGSLRPGAGALADPYALELKLKGESPFRCSRTRGNILIQALYFAVMNGKLDAARLLVSQGADVNAIVPGLDVDATILHRVVSMETPRLEDAVRFLVDHGANLNARDEEYGGTPLGWARYGERRRAFQLLRSLGASD